MRWQDTGEGIGVIQFTMAMLAVYIAVFLAEVTQTNLAVLQAFPWRLGHGETWRLLTGTALHGGLLHFGFNIMWFFRFSQAIERWLGPWAALGMYVFFAAGAGAPQAVFSEGFAIGASGVVYGLFGFLWVCRRRYDIAAEIITPPVVQTMIGWLIICAVINRFGGNIANIAHLFGLVFGCLLGLIVVATRRTRWPLIAATALLWAQLVSLTLKPVWEQVIRPVPVINSAYRFVELDEAIWQAMENAHGKIDAARVW
jgi:GlpG protein